MFGLLPLAVLSQCGNHYNILQRVYHNLASVIADTDFNL